MNKEIIKLAASIIVRRDMNKTSGIFDIDLDSLGLSEAWPQISEFWERAQGWEGGEELTDIPASSDNIIPANLSWMYNRVNDAYGDSSVFADSVDKYIPNFSEDYQDINLWDAVSLLRNKDVLGNLFSLGALGGSASD